MKIGIFLGYGPHVIMGKEGLGRYLGTLLSGFLKEQHVIVIAYPVWLTKSLDALFADFGIDKEKGIQRITTIEEPPLWRVYNWLFMGKREGFLRRFTKRVRKYGKGRLVYIENKLATAKSVLPFVFWSAWASVLGFIVSFLGGGLFLTRRALRGIHKSVLFFIGKAGFSRERYDSASLRCFRLMGNMVCRDLVDRINHSGEAPAVWYVPSLFWPEARNIQNGLVVFNAPDLVSEEFPMGFSDRGRFGEAQIAEVRQSLHEGQRFITYCEFLRRELLIDEYGKEAGQVVSITHAVNDMMPYLVIDAKVQEQNNTTKDYVEAFAKSLLSPYTHAKYIFYASQLRPNKNILNLIKAYEYLLRNRFIGVKLFLTAALSGKELEYVREHQLEDEVVSFYNVPAQKLAALYYCAELVVNPSMYEGGFFFTFGEGMSVGTPSVMADIPQTREVLEPAGLEDVMFDPHDWRAMADKIEYALNHKEELYKKELPLYQELAKRTPAVEAADYVKAFQYFIEENQKSYA